MQFDTVVCGDCLDVMAEMPDECVDLVIADPPFNIGKDYGVCRDNNADYWSWTKDWLESIWRLIRDGGSCYFKNHWQNLGLFDLLIRSLTDVIVRNVIVWQKDAGYASSVCYSMRWEAVWFVTKGDGHTFNLDDIRMPPKTNDKRNNPRGKNPTDCWYIPRVAHGSSQRVNHPCQSPEGLVKRMIRASSNFDDMAFDPFMGSGTTAVAALKLGRHFYGCDINQAYVDIANARIAKAQQEMTQLAIWEV